MTNLPPPDSGKYWQNFPDFFSFDEHWRNWIDDPPLGWRPPKDKRIWTHVFDSMDQAGWVVRIDAWLDAQGVHLHFRWVAMVIGPRREDHEQWVEDGEDDDNPPEPTWFVSKRGVMGWVLNWWQMTRMQDEITDVQDDKQNGHGQELREGDDSL